MKRAVVVVVWILAISVYTFGFGGHEAQAQQGLTKIADGVYSYIDEKNPTPDKSFGANSGIIIGRDGIVVVDTRISSKEAQRFIKDIKAVSDKPIKYVVNTHYHLDHALGNGDFIKLGATVIAQMNCKKNIRDNAGTVLLRAKNYGLTDEMMQGTKPAEPSMTFDSRMEIDLGDRKVALINTGASHTDDSIVVYVPDAKVLFAGDILFTNFHPNMRDGDIASWVKALDSIMAMDVAAIIPGHGPLSTKKDIQDMKQYLITFDRIGRDLSAQGKDVKYIAAEILKAVPKREFFEMFVAGNVSEKYLEK
jgi:glyoxylase-like metal-dependent hydrolase (beta-lactamase superfamily II)